MVKRAFWVAIGAGFGFGMSIWTMRAVRRTADKYLPPSLIDRIERAVDALDGGGTARDGAREPASSLRARVAGHPAAAGLRALAGGLTGSSAQDDAD